MKRHKVFSLVGILLVVFLAACSGTSPEVSTTDPESDSDVQSTSVDAAAVEIADLSQLVVGTMLLAETDYPVTPEQAEAMLPLWQLYQSMMAEDTTASEELDAIVKQIQKLLSAEQLAEIAAVQYDNPMEIMEELGIEPSDMTTIESGSIDDLPEDIRNQLGTDSEGVFVIEGGSIGSGDIPSGELPEGFGSGEANGGAVEIDPERLTELQAQSGGIGSLQARLFLPALIEYLEEIAAS